MDYHFRQLIAVPEKMSRTFFELPCVTSAEKYPDTQHIVWHLKNVMDYSSRHLDEKIWDTATMTGVLAEDYQGQWWHLTTSEYEDYVETLGLAYESMR